MVGRNGRATTDFIEQIAFRYRKILEMATKYDTNPLDPDFPARAKAATATMPAEEQTQALRDNDARTRPFPTNLSEDETRQFSGANFSSYASPYNGQNIPAHYPPVDLADMNESSSRKVEKIGLPENVLTALPYIPWYIGMVVSLIVLFVAPKSEAKVRFHAAQGLAAHIGILIVTSILGAIGNITDVAEIGNFAFLTVTTVMMLIFAWKAWKGKPIHIESVDSLTNWLEEKISPK